MNDESMKEFIHRLKDEGFAFQPSTYGIGAVTNKNGNSVTLDEDGSVLYKTGNQPMAMRVMGLYNQVQEYMTAFLSAQRSPGSKSPDTRTLLLYNNCELAATKFSNNNMEFATWRLDRNGKREIGHYFDNYKVAKYDFAIRAELINRNLLLSEKELTVIRSNLSDYLDCDSAFIPDNQEKAMKEVISKIDNVIAPEIQENEEQTSDLGYEPEQEL